MFDSLSINSFRGSYEVHFVEDYVSALMQNLREGDCVFIDENVFALHPALDTCTSQAERILISPSEKSKTFQSLAPFIDKIMEQNFSKEHRLVCIGGGSAQDITGFIASILYRGVRWHFYPTNLLTQCDSCIGSKTSINFRNFKNQLGSFHPPEKVFIDLAFLRTLPNEEFRSGMGEMLHYFLVSGEADFDLIETAFDDADKDERILAKLIRRSLEIKKAMVEIDEFDEGPRNVFNYGHSFGHALEAASGFTLPHGIAVSYGMDIANVISANRGMIAMSLRNRVRKTLEKVWKGFSLNNINPSIFSSALLRDKKNEGGEVRVILTKGFGSMFKTSLQPDEDGKHLLNQYFHEQLYKRDL